MKNLQEWFSISELMAKNYAELPSSDKGIVKKAQRENWEKRQREGIKGKTFEYHYSSLPPAVQQQLGFDVVEENFVHKGDDFEYINEMQVSANGTGESQRFAFRAEWLKKMAINAAHCTFFKMPDDAMERTIYQGDRALVRVYFHKDGNLTKRGIKTLEELWQLKDGLYMVQINTRLTIRRLQFDLNQGLYIGCDNPLYQSLHLTQEQIDPTFIVGQVCWYAHSVQWD